MRTLDEDFDRLLLMLEDADRQPAARRDPLLASSFAMLAGVRHRVMQTAGAAPSSHLDTVFDTCFRALGEAHGSARTLPIAIGLLRALRAAFGATRHAA